VGTLVSSTNKTDCHNLVEILLKVALNTITIIKMMFVVSFFSFVFFSDTVPSNNILFWVTSRNLSFILSVDCPIICKTVKYIDKSDNSYLCVLSFDTSRFIWLIADWSVENMNTDVTAGGYIVIYWHYT